MYFFYYHVKILFFSVVHKLYIDFKILYFLDKNQNEINASYFLCYSR